MVASAEDQDAERQAVTTARRKATKNTISNGHGVATSFRTTARTKLHAVAQEFGSKTTMGGVAQKAALQRTAEPAPQGSARAPRTPSTHRSMVH
ncbi:hypothetical protein ERJ75_000118500 [Trypanosoma vivax]|nr:hypothetical protein ERJ75_000118500 [Trypanosoma vivax]